FALYGTLVSLLRRDWRVFPLLVWFLAIFYLLWQQMPLWSHHLVTLVPPLVLLATMSLLQYPQTNWRDREKRLVPPDPYGQNRSNTVGTGLVPVRVSAGGTLRPVEPPTSGQGQALSLRNWGSRYLGGRPALSRIFALGNSITVITLCI